MFIKMSGFAKISPNYTSTLIGLDNGKNISILISDLIKLINNNIVTGLKGVAVAATVPDSPKNGDYYIAGGTGTFTNFKDSTNTAISVTTADNFAYLVYNGTYWTKVSGTVNLNGYVPTTSIVNNLTSTDATKVLGADQGAALKALIPVATVAPGKNLFNPATITTGQIFNYANGALSANTNGAVSDFIPVLPSTTYTISGRITSSGTRGVVYYDTNKTIIATPTGPTTWGDGALNGQYTTTAATAYMRITVMFSGTGNPAVVQVEKGSVATAFEAYYDSVTALAGKQIIAYKVVTETGNVYLPDYLTAKGYSTVSTIDVPSSINLFNQATILSGFHINTTTGLPTAGTGSSMSDYIAVTPDTDYFISGRVNTTGDRGFVFYDASKALISTPPSGADFTSGPANGLYHTTANTYFVRFTTAFTGTGTPSSVQFEKGSIASTYVAYSSYKAIDTVNSVSVNPKPDAILAAVDVKIRTKWYGKKICWMGTSIPANYPATDKLGSYPNIAAARLGATIINESLASSLLRIASTNGTALVSPYNAVSFGKTGAELTAGGFSSANSYETKMLGHLDADLFVFDFGYNDFSVDNTNFATTPGTINDRNTFIGAFNYCIMSLLQAKPKARFAIFGHYENQLRPLISQAQQVVGDYWSCRVYPTWTYTNWSTKTVPGSSPSTTVLNAWLPDGIHPGADTTGAATGVLANIAEGFLRLI